MSTNRRLFFHGFVFLALAPFAGFLILAPVANPRGMLSLHVATWLAGGVTCAAAAAWPHVKLSATALAWTERGVLVGMWVGFAFGLWNAVMGTATMFAGGGTAPAWAEQVVKVFQAAITLTLVPALVSLAVGLGRSDTAS